MTAELFVSRLGPQVRTALREDGLTVELRSDGPSEAPRVGELWLTRVSAVVPGMDAAFCDLAGEPAALLHARDLVLPGERIPEPRSADSGRRTRPPLADRLRAGRELIVQVVREADGAEGAKAVKGARVSCALALAGRRLVLLPQSERRSVSRRIPAGPERERLAALVAALPGSVGILARTAAAGSPAEALAAEARAALERWERIRGDAERGGAPRRLEEAPDLVLATLCDAPAGGFARVVVDDARDLERIRDWDTRTGGGAFERLERHEGPGSLFSDSGIDRDLAQALGELVRLPSGGHLILERTAALVSVDVNTGRSASGAGQRESILATNLDAVRETVRQLRLRDLGGIVVIDLVDMQHDEDRRQVLEALAAALARDPARGRVLDSSAAGLVVLARQRRRPDLATSLSVPCPRCAGRGRLPAPATVVADAIAALRRAAGRGPRVLHVHPEVAVLARLHVGPGERDVTWIEDPALAPERFVVPGKDEESGSR